MQATRAASSMPLAGSAIYRPGAGVAALVVLAPILAASGALAAGLFFAPDALRWLPYAFFGFIPCLALFWFALKSVRTSPEGIAVGRPWAPWKELTWDSIRHVDSRGWRLFVTSEKGRRLTFTPGLLREGDQLVSSLLSRLPLRVFTDQFSAADDVQDAAGLRAQGRSASHPTSLFARPNPLYRIVCITCAAILLVAALIVWLTLPPLVGVILAVVCVALATFPALGALWLTQDVSITDAGATVKALLPPGTRQISWNDVGVLEHSPALRFIRLRKDKQVLLAGPGLFQSPYRGTYRALLREYCLARGIPPLRRNWML